MKMRALATALCALLTAGSANAVPSLVAGWDFSQYIAGFLSTDGGNTLTNVLPSNYSDLDATQAPGIGDGSTVHGTMHVDGLFGSFDSPLDGADPFRPLDGNIAENENNAAVAGVTMGGPAAGNILLLGEAPPSQGQFNTNRMVARAGGPTPLDVVFEADLGPSFLGDAFSVSFAGRTSTGGSVVQVEFSTDGSAYAPVGTANLNTTDTGFSFALGGDDLDQVFVRLRFEGSTTILPSIDNLTILAEVTQIVSEPGTALMGLAGLMGLGVFGRRRS